MTTRTANLNLAKSEASDYYQTTRTDNNANWEIIDALGLGGVTTATGTSSATGVVEISHGLGAVPDVVCITPTGSYEVAPSWRATSTKLYVNCADEPFKWFAVVYS